MKLLYDCDAGADDALALRLLCKNRIELLGVSTCFGGFPPENAAVQAENILREYEMTVPVCVGARTSLRGVGAVHSEAALPWDGLRMEAGQFLREKLTGATVLLATGPLTNAAAMLRSASCRPAQIVIMGGGIHGGNRTPDAEFNFFCDPEAADEVLQGGCPVTLLPLEAAKDCAMSEDDAALLSPAAGNDLRAQLAFARRAHGSSTVIPYDAVAAAGLCDPRVFAETRQCACRVNSAGKLLISPGDGNVTLVEYADPDLFKNIFFSI